MGEISRRIGLVRARWSGMTRPGWPLVTGHRLLMNIDGEESGVPGAGCVPGHGLVRLDDSVQRSAWVPGHHVPGGVRARCDVGATSKLSAFGVGERTRTSTGSNTPPGPQRWARPSSTVATQWRSGDGVGERTRTSTGSNTPPGPQRWARPSSTVATQWRSGVSERGLEPPRGVIPHQALNLARLPIPPLRLEPGESTPVSCSRGRSARRC